jgi:hypothetical protein
LNELLGHPVCGGSWEGFVLENVTAYLPQNAHAYFYRSSAGAEIDLLIEIGTQRLAIEIKRSLSPVVSKGFHIACKDVNATMKLLVYPGDESYPIAGGIQVMGIKDLVKLIEGY